MNSQTSSPLAKYTRQPKLYVSLPSGGNWYAKNNLEKADEVEVYSMTAADEINLKTPDGLYTGKVVTSTIQNCIPSIKDAWMIPMVDFDYIMAALRMATYGEKITLTSNCNKCQNEDSYQIDIQNIMSHLETAEFQTEISVEGFLIRIRPLYYREITEINKVNTFVQRALVQTIPKISDEEEKTATIENLYEQINSATTNAIVSCVTEIVTPDGDSESNPQFIKDFILNSDPKFYNAVEATYKQNRNNMSLPSNTVECSECSNTYQISTNLDYATFFGKG